MFAVLQITAGCAVVITLLSLYIQFLFKQWITITTGTIWIRTAENLLVINLPIVDVSIGLVTAYILQSGLNKFQIWNQYLIGRVDPFLFLCYDMLSEKYSMDRDKLKLIVRNLELLVDNLKAEVYSDTAAYTNPDVRKRPVFDYDEIFEDDDGYAD